MSGNRITTSTQPTTCKHVLSTFSGCAIKTSHKFVHIDREALAMTLRLSCQQDGWLEHRVISCLSSALRPCWLTFNLHARTTEKKRARERKQSGGGVCRSQTRGHSQTPWHRSRLKKTLVVQPHVTKYLS